jgi:hypothetical protein
MRQMNKQNNKKKKSTLSWIHKNRIKIGIWLFLIVLPISLIITAYVGSYTSNNSVYFDAEITEESEEISDFIAADELMAIKLNIEWDALRKPSEGDQGQLTGGYYRFKISYTSEPNFEIENVKITPVLRTDWKNYSSIGIERFITETDMSISIDFNFDLPHSPLLFITIEEPILYLKVEYSFQSAGQTMTEIEYVKYSLKDLNPNTVVPAT